MKDVKILSYKLKYWRTFIKEIYPNEIKLLLCEVIIKIFE